VLVSLLPGLRDLRTPLAVGYLWLIGLWLWFGDSFPRRAADVPDATLRSLFELSTAVGASVVLAAVSFAAYLLGTMLLVRFRWNVVCFEPMMTELNSIFKLGIPIARFFLKGYGSPLRNMRSQLDSQFEKKFGGPQAADKLDALSPQQFATLTGRRGAPPATGQTRVEVAVSAAECEMEEVGIRLQAANRDIWDTFDRCRAETEFRSAIVLPLSFIIVSATINHSWWWLVGMIAPWWLLVLAARKAIEATATLVQAISLGIVEPPIFDRWEEMQASSSS
jgi:hypothetical protein